MKVGDLVELSAYGKNLKCNRKQVDNVGLVVAVDVIESLGSGIHPMTAVNVRWAGDKRSLHQIRRDLKYAK